MMSVATCPRCERAYWAEVCVGSKIHHSCDRGDGQIEELLTQPPEGRQVSVELVACVVAGLPTVRLVLRDSFLYGSMESYRAVSGFMLDRLVDDPAFADGIRRMIADDLLGNLIEHERARRASGQSLADLRAPYSTPQKKGA
jgi:hypothetical protein